MRLEVVRVGPTLAGRDSEANMVRFLGESLRLEQKYQILL